MTVTGEATGTTCCAGFQPRKRRKRKPHVSSGPTPMCRMLLFLCLLPIHPQCKTSHYFTAAAAAAAASATGGGSTFRARTGSSNVNSGGRRRRPRSSGRSSLATTALKMHKLYVGQPPHDTSLYDLLGVAGNATLNEIQKAYRKKSREYHPE